MTEYVKTEKLAYRHFSISSFFEASKYAYEVFLYMALSPLESEYGKLATLFAAAYFAANFTSFETGNAFLQTLYTYKDKNIFPSLMNRLVYFPFVCHSIGAGLAAWGVSSFFDTPCATTCAVASIAFCEGFRTTLRPVIYSQSAVYSNRSSSDLALGEAVISCSYMLAMGGVWYFAPHLFTTPFIVAAYAIASACGFIYLVSHGYAIAQKYRIRHAHLPYAHTDNIGRTQLVLILSHSFSSIFQPNFLISLCAQTTGFAAAGTLKMLSTIAITLRTILKATVALPLNALFAQSTSEEKDADVVHSLHLAVKKAATNILGSFILLATFISLGGLLFYPLENIERAILFFSLLIIFVTDYFCIPYEIIALYTQRITEYGRTRAGWGFAGLAAIMALKSNMGVLVAVLAVIQIITIASLIRKAQAPRPLV